MKKFFSALLVTALVICSMIMPASATSEKTSIDIKMSNLTHEISQQMYGVFLEDISYAVDGGLNGNLICNNSFEYESKDFYGWNVDKNVKILTENPMNKNNTRYVQVNSNGNAKLENIGFVEYYQYKSEKADEKAQKLPDIGFKKNQRYDISFWTNNINFDGQIKVYFCDNKGKLISDFGRISNFKNQWTQYKTSVVSNKQIDGKIVFEFIGNGKIDFDFVNLTSQNSHGYDSKQWKNATLRKDMYEALVQLSPAFLRFPGGCLVEGDSVEHLVNWKNTIGDVQQRKQEYNLWRTNDENATMDYNNSWSIGYHEYFQLAEDLKAEPIPVVNVGVACQARVNNPFAGLEIGSEKWDNYVQDVLDLIEYANGDTSTIWGAKRAENGHPKPFNMKYIGLGNENWGEIYFEHFDYLKKAINEKYPEIQIIASSGTWHEGEDFENSWETIDENYSDVIVDEHYYTDTDFLFNNTDRYDYYDRKGADVFLGEYGSTKYRGTLITKCALHGALAEAAYMTGLERNGDLVKMSSFAPTFAKHNAQQWRINMLWFDSQRVVQTPEYYNQLLNSNNYGNQLIDTVFNKKIDNLYQVVSVDKSKQELYIKIINANSSGENVTLNFEGFGNLNDASLQYMSNISKEATNTFKRFTIAPKEENIKLNGNESLELKIKPNSINIIRIGYGNNDGSSFYKLSNMPKTQLYIPQKLRNLFYVLSGVIPLIVFVSVTGKFLRKKLKK